MKTLIVGLVSVFVAMLLIGCGTPPMAESRRNVQQWTPDGQLVFSDTSVSRTEGNNATPVYHEEYEPGYGPRIVYRDVFPSRPVGGSVSFRVGGRRAGGWNSAGGSTGGVAFGP